MDAQLIESANEVVENLGKQLCQSVFQLAGVEGDVTLARPILLMHARDVIRDLLAALSTADAAAQPEPLDHTWIGFIRLDEEGRPKGQEQQEVYYRDFPEFANIPSVIQTREIWREWDAWWTWKRRQTAAPAL